MAEEKKEVSSLWKIIATALGGLLIGSTPSMYLTSSNLVNQEDVKSYMQNHGAYNKDKKYIFSSLETLQKKDSVTKMHLDELTRTVTKLDVTMQHLTEHMREIKQLLKEKLK